jgi:hypothetical protein
MDLAKMGKTMIGPLLANGMVLIPVYMLWGLALIGTGLFAAIAVVLAFLRRGREEVRRLAISSLVASLTPFAVPLLNWTALSQYGSNHDAPVILSGFSLWVLMVSGLAVYVSRRTPTKGPK